MSKWEWQVGEGPDRGVTLVLTVRRRGFAGRGKDPRLVRKLGCKAQHAASDSWETLNKSL